MPFLGKNKTTALLIFILLTGFVLRISNIGFGLPYITLGDETKYLPKAMNMVFGLDFNPRYFGNPTFLSYIYYFLMLIYYIIYKALSLFIPLGDFRKLWESDPTIFYIIARSMNAVLGAGTCLILYRSVKKLFSETVGIITCILLSFCFLHVKDSHYAVNDVPSIFFMVLAFGYIVNIWLDNKSTSYSYALAGMISGIAIATKYHTAIAMVAFSVVYFLKREHQKVEGGQKLFLFYLFGLIGFCICCPWVILDTKMFLSDFKLELLKLKNPWLGQSAESSYIQILKTLLWGYGLIPCIFFVIGSILLIRKRQLFILLMAFPVAYYILLGWSRMFNARYTMPLIPFLCISSAYGIVSVSNYFSKYATNRIIILLTFLALIQGFIFSIRHNYLIGKTDSRIIARNWVRGNIPSGSKIATEGYCPNLRNFPKDSSIKSYEVHQLWKELPKRTIRDYYNEGYNFLITSEFIRQRYVSNKKKYPAESSFYSLLDSSTERLYSSDTCNKNLQFFLDDIYSPFWNLFILDKPGPCISVYKIKDS